MGEVYKANDTRFDRIVAVKISNAEFSERFEREARAVAALNHPHICTLYDVGPNYLVMEHIEGEPLKGPLPVEQVFADLRRAGGGAPERDHASGFEAGQHSSDESGSEAAGFWSGEVRCSGGGRGADGRFRPAEGALLCGPATGGNCFLRRWNGL